MNINDLTEKEIARIWQYQMPGREELLTEDGEPLQVIYPGWLNDEEGPDFRQAVIVIGRKLSQGDVEIHLRSSGWQEHGHQRDAAYNRVILHVVMWHNGVATRLQNGGVVPVLALERYVTLPVSQHSDLGFTSAGSHLSCLQIAQRLNTDGVAEFLDRAGDERFLFKAARFQKDLTHLGGSQCLYQGIMGAFGYSRNKLPFLELARRLPLRILNAVTQGDVSDEEWLARLQALFLGTAGLLPVDYQLDSSFPDAAPMPREAWHLMRVRPNNSPILRLVAMSHLLLRYRRKGLLEGLVGLVRDAPLDRDGPKRLEAGLVVTNDNISCPSSASGRLEKLTLLGRGRAADIVVNVLLPFVCAWSQSVSQPELGSKALDLYRLYPRLMVNSVERYMTRQLGLSTSLVNSASRLINSASRQQGLIHIYKNLCCQGRCGSCLLTHSQPGHHI